jgi:prepilin peptidase CpaA
VSACVLASGADTPLPAFGWAAAFFFIAVERDVRELRIPNWLTFPAFGLAVAYATATEGAPGAAASLLGAVVALGILLLPYSLGWLGAGDVKAMVVIGALWGAGVLIPVTAWAIGLGGVIAIAWISIRGGLRDLALRWWQTFFVSLATRKWTYTPPAPGSPAAGGIPFAVAMGLAVAGGIPFAVAMGLAVAAYGLWGAPWA